MAIAAALNRSGRPMTLVSLVMLTVRVSIALNVMALGLGSSVADTTYLFRRPAALFKALLAMNVVMPAIAVLLAIGFSLHPAVKVGLVALSVSPIPPILPRKALKAGGHGSYVIGLLVAAAVLSIAFIPAVLELLQRVFRVELGIAPWAVAKLVIMTVLGPLTVGIVVRRLAPAFATRISKPVAAVGVVLLLVGALPIVATSFRDIVSLIGNGTILAIAAFIVAGLIVGYALGGPDSNDRTVLSLSTSSRHPGIAMAIAHTDFPQQKLALAAIGLYLIVNLILGVPFLRWTKRRRSSDFS